MIQFALDGECDRDGYDDADDLTDEEFNKKRAIDYCLGLVDNPEDHPQERWVEMAQEVHDRREVIGYVDEIHNCKSVIEVRNMFFESIMEDLEK